MRLSFNSHGPMGFRLSLVTKRYLRTLWIRWPSLTKLSRRPR